MTTYTDEEIYPIVRYHSSQYTLAMCRSHWDQGNLERNRACDMSERKSDCHVGIRKCGYIWFCFTCTRVEQLYDHWQKWLFEAEKRRSGQKWSRSIEKQLK